jgi:hypothetical protein
VSREVQLGDWAEIDPWWSVYTQACPVVTTHTWARPLLTEELVNRWEDLDKWWRSCRDSTLPAPGAGSTRASINERLTDSWEEFEPWWDIYTEIGRDTAVEIADLFVQSNEEWRTSVAAFDTDPLASTVNRTNGPLLPSTEEGWSDWLANLLRRSPGFVAELFDVTVDQPPDQVIREKQLSKEEGGFRRPDILVLYPDRGVSIEVKLGDPHYGKTSETAWLTENEYSEQTWTHTLLLPQRYTSRLRANVEPSVSDHPDYGLQVEWETPGPVSVIYWREVTEAIRTLLCRGETVDDHWAANAYLFCAAVEQRILNFATQPMIEQMAEPASVVDETNGFRLAGELEEQLTYLSARQGP